MQRGFSTLEILMAMFIIVITLSAVVITSFGSQSLLIGGQTDAEAMNEGQNLLEQEQAFARKDFNLVTSTTSTDGIYTRNVTVTQLPDLLSKNVTVTVTWQDEHNQTRSLTLTTLVTNFNNAIGGDTCSSVLSGNWTQPKVASQLSLDTALGTTTAYAISDVDAYKGMLYVTVAKTPYAGAPSFFVFDISNPTNPVLKGYIDNAPSTTDGLSAVRVAENLSTTPEKIYAYVASDHTANFASCAQANNCAQLQVIDVTNPAAPAVVTNFKANGVTSSSGGVGNSIFYDNGYVFLGLTSTGGYGPELHVIAVQSPLSPYEVGAWPGGVSLGHDINAIDVSDGYAYIATPNSQELMVLNVTNPATPTPTGTTNVPGYDAPDGVGNGKSINVVGDTVYLGRTVTATHPEFYILDATNPAASSFPVLGSSNIADSVNGVITRDYLSFLLTNSKFLVMNATSTAQVASPLALPASGSANYEPSMDCENNTFYIGSNNSSDNGTISVVTSS